MTTVKSFSSRIIHYTLLFFSRVYLNYIISPTQQCTNTRAFFGTRRSSIRILHSRWFMRAYRSIHRYKNKCTRSGFGGGGCCRGRIEMKSLSRCFHFFFFFSARFTFRFFSFVFPFVRARFSSLSQRQSRWWMIFREAFRVVLFFFLSSAPRSVFVTRPFRHVVRVRGTRAGHDKGLFFRERLNVKQETAAVAGQSFVGGGRDLVYTYNITVARDGSAAAGWARSTRFIYVHTTWKREKRKRRVCVRVRECVVRVRERTGRDGRRRGCGHQWLG